MIIAVDFDGTIVEHKYPAIGAERPFATATLRQLIKDGHKLILWSVREGDLLQQAIDWCEARGVRFYAANADLEEETFNDQKVRNYSRKIKADLFIDDRNIGGLLGWGEMYEMISKHLTYEQYQERVNSRSMQAQPEKKKAWWKF